MPYVLTIDEYVVDEILKFKHEEGNEMFDLEIRLTGEDVEFIRNMIKNAEKKIDPTEEEENEMWDRVFKNQREDALEKIGKYQMSRGVDFAIGLVVDKVGLDRTNTFNSATMKLQKTMTKKTR